MSVKTDYLTTYEIRALVMAERLTERQKESIENKEYGCQRVDVIVRADPRDFFLSSRFFTS